MRNFFKDIMLDTKGFFSLSKTLTSALFDASSFTRWAVCKVMAFLLWLLSARAKIYILFIVLFKCGFPFTRITLSYHASAYVGISFNSCLLVYVKAKIIEELNLLEWWGKCRIQLSTVLSLSRVFTKKKNNTQKNTLKETKYFILILN